MKINFSPHIAMQINYQRDLVSILSSIMGMEVIKQDNLETHVKKDNMNFYFEESEDNKVYFEFSTDNLIEAIDAFKKFGCHIEETNTLDGAVSYFVYTPQGFRFHLWEELT